MGTLKVKMKKLFQMTKLVQVIPVLRMVLVLKTALRSAVRKALRKQMMGIQVIPVEKTKLVLMGKKTSPVLKIVLRPGGVGEGSLEIMRKRARKRMKKRARKRIKKRARKRMKKRARKRMISIIQVLPVKKMVLVLKTALRSAVRKALRK